MIKYTFILLLLIFDTNLSYSNEVQDSIELAENTLNLEIPQTFKSYYIEPGTYGTKRESDPPNYIRSLDKVFYKKSKNLNWLDLGLDYRTRFEYRQNDIRRPESFNNDFPFLLRTRAYLGLKNIIDPFRMVVELEDARRVNGNYPLDNRDVNTFELIQAYGELHFKNALKEDKLGNNRPIIIRGGRQTFEFLDRRLIALNQWRNTTNNFLGLRGQFGQDSNDWQIDVLALKPIDRMIDKFDKVNKYQYFYGVIGHWRRWSDKVTIEPYYLALTQKANVSNGNKSRNIQGLGLRLTGWIKNSGINYEFTGIYQMGKDNLLKQRAYMVTGEMGYTLIDIPAKPRFSVFYGYVSGDKNPNDKVSNRFDRYFGFGRPWSADDYIIAENITTFKTKAEFELFKKVKIDGGYSLYWLASSTDRFNNFLSGSSFNRDLLGESSNKVGQGLDFRIRFKPTTYLNANIGYSHFTTGEFVRNRQQVANNSFAKSSNFAYIEMDFNLFDLVKHLHAKK